MFKITKPQEKANQTIRLTSLQLECLSQKTKKVKNDVKEKMVWRLLINLKIDLSYGPNISFL